LRNYSIIYGLVIAHYVGLQSGLSSATLFVGGNMKKSQNIRRWKLK